MSRPAAVALAVLVLVAGCSGAPTTGTQTATTAPPETVTTHAETTPTPPPTTHDGYYERYEFAATPITDAEMAREVALTPDDVETEVGWRGRSFTQDLFDDGRADRVVIDEPTPETTPGPFENGTVVRANGTFYEVEKRVVGRHEGRADAMRRHGPIREGREEYARADREAVTASDLSPEDRHVFAYALPSPSERDSGVTSAGYTWTFPVGDDPADSRLVDGETHYVRYDGGLYRVEGERTEERAVRYRIEYDLVPVADSASAFAEARRDSLATAVARKNASGDGAESVPRPVATVVFAALSGETVTWEGEGDAPARYPATAEWILAHPPDGSTTYVRYGGELYRLSVSKLVE